MIVIKTSSDNKQILEKIALKLLNQKSSWMCELVSSMYIIFCMGQ